MGSWFVVDLFAILPLDFILNTVTSDVNSLIRITRISKLYKLVKITRLIRLVKIIKQKGRLFKSLGTVFKVGAGFEKLSFFIIVLSLLCHCVACMWIFSTTLDEAVQEEDPPAFGGWNNLEAKIENINWISKNGF